MAHHHHDHHSHHHASGNIKQALFINLAFTIIEIVGGLMTNSMAILSDALHDLGDSVSLGMAWYFQSKSKQKADDKYSFGYTRFSVLGAVIMCMVLITGSGIIVYKAIPRILEPEVSNAMGMFVLSIIGIVFNGAAVLRMKKGTSLNERAVTLHLMEDVLGWVAVLIGSILIYFFHWYIVDAILSLGIAAYIAYNAISTLSQSLRVFLQGTPKDIDQDQLEAELMALPDLSDVHDMHIWSMDGEYNLASLHAVTKLTDPNQLKALRINIRQVFANHNIEHVTVEVHDPIDDCEFEDCN